MIHNFCMCMEAKINGSLGSCSLCVCDNYRNNPRKVMKHPSYTFAWVAEKMHFKSPSDLKQNKPTTLAEERTGSRHMAIKKKSLAKQNLYEILMNMKFIRHITYYSFLLLLSNSRLRSDSMPSSQWSCPHSLQYAAIIYNVIVYHFVYVSQSSVHTIYQQQLWKLYLEKANLPKIW